MLRITISSKLTHISKKGSKKWLTAICESGKPGVEGAGDHRIQAYCYRMTLTNHPDNRIPFKPSGYQEIDYELLLETMRRQRATRKNVQPGICSMDQFKNAQP